jgi:hypothetical protein
MGKAKRAHQALQRLCCWAQAEPFAQPTQTEALTQRCNHRLLAHCLVNRFQIAHYRAGFIRREGYWP